MPDVEEEELINDEVYQQEEVECNILNTNDHETNIEVSLHRDDIEPETVLRTNDQENEEDDFINDHHTDVSEDEESEEESLADNDGEDIESEMKGTGRGKIGRGGVKSGRGNSRGRESFGTTSQPQLQPIRVTKISLEIGQISSHPLPRTSLETQSSRNLEESTLPSPEVETGTVSHVNRKRGTGKYKSKFVDITTKYGGKIKVIIPHDIDRAVGSGARDIVNYSGLIMRSSISFRDENWQKIILKHGEAMWYKVKDKFEVCDGLKEHKLQGFVISTMQRLFRAWKARLHKFYSAYSTDEDRLSHRPEDVELEDWKYLVKEILNREKKTHQIKFGRFNTRKNTNGEREWLDPQSQQIHGQLQQLVVEQQSDEIEHRMTRDDILSSVLGERSGYVQGKGYGKKPPKKTQIQQADIEASVSSAMESMRQEMQADMDRKLQEKREQMTADLKRNMEEDLQKNLEEEREDMKGKVDKMFQEQMAAIMTRMQHVLSLALEQFFSFHCLFFLP
ncbi:hypothetical protein KY290_017391 [Solanum tuberosum]|uniref:Uncharacterized protein n=1 Tax=Solanum tuberosum TaxID=4113 RepID=A0ABQ7VD96_SOLTU|nr:hypothetical protein KY290_017391 [Solanum tuberosum]